MSMSILAGLWLGVALAGPHPVELAAEQELERALTLSLPGQPTPYLVVLEVLDGVVATMSASFGALSSEDDGPYRNLRAEVRVGDYALDNSNFQVGYGERDGVRLRWLPQEDVSLALRREMWLALDEAYKGAAEQFSAKLAAREGRQLDPFPEVVPLSPFSLPHQELESEVDGAEVRRVVEHLSGLLSSWPMFEDGDAIMRDWRGQRLIVSSEGVRAWLPTGYTVVRVEASMRAADGTQLRNSRSWVARTPAGLPSIDQMSAEVLDMATWLENLDSAATEDDYLGPVLFEEAAAVELFRQLLLPELSGSPAAEEPPDPYSEIEGAPPRARLGRRLLPEGWQVTDDALAWPDEAGAYGHDFEGVGVRPVSLIENGVVRDLLMSRIPRQGFGPSTGHGRGLGADRRLALPAVVRVEPKRERSERRLRRRALSLASQTGLPYVLVVRRLESPALSEDFRVAFSGDAPLPGLTRPLEAYRLYPDGREEPVRGLEFVGVDRRVLRDIAIAGSVSAPVGVMDVGPGAGRFNMGAVGGLPATWMAPAVVVTELELRNVSGGEPRLVPMPPSEKEPMP